MYKFLLFAQRNAISFQIIPKEQRGNTGRESAVDPAVGIQTSILCQTVSHQPCPSSTGGRLLLHHSAFLVEECPAYLDSFPFRTASQGTLATKPLTSLFFQMTSWESSTLACRGVSEKLPTNFHHRVYLPEFAIPKAINPAAIPASPQQEYIGLLTQLPNTPCTSSQSLKGCLIDTCAMLSSSCSGSRSLAVASTAPEAGKSTSHRPIPCITFLPSASSSTTSCRASFTRPSPSFCGARQR